VDGPQGRYTLGRWLRILAGLAITGFAAVLAAVIASRLSDDALAVLAGAVCGVGSAISTSLLFILLSRWCDETRARPPAIGPQGQRSPIIVITPPAGQQSPGAWDRPPASMRESERPRFTVVGGAPDETETPR
jgi:drug/metabolite transporter (DMT)-like permease